jgi:hypothetical protein
MLKPRILNILDLHLLIWLQNKISTDLMVTIHFSRFSRAPCARRTAHKSQIPYKSFVRRAPCAGFLEASKIPGGLLPLGQPRSQAPSSRYGKYKHDFFVFNITFLRQMFFWESIWFSLWFVETIPQTILVQQHSHDIFFFFFKIDNFIPQLVQKQMYIWIEAKKKTHTIQKFFFFFSNNK